MSRSLALLLVTAFCVVGCQQPAPPATPAGPEASLTLANFERIHEGMTLGEVEAFLGPPGSKGIVDVARPDGSVVKDVRTATWFWFRATAGTGHDEQESRRIVVHLEDGKVTSKEQVGLQ
jgi:hypothetical protein